MRVRIHRGTSEIGGNCVELESNGQRVILDLGRPLWAEPDEEVPLPPAAGLDTGDDPTLLGVILSHPHQDHYGLLEDVHPAVPVYIGEAASRILSEASFFGVTGMSRTPAGFLRDQEPLRLGPFRVTPYLVDHSAFDAYSLLVEADGRRLFYTGDFRGHGRKAALFERLLREPPGGVDVLLTEGTQIRTSGDAQRSLPTEDQIEEKLTDTFRSIPGMALIVFSAQNIDRLTTMYRAAIRAQRHLVVDLYTATIARATGRASIPQPGHRGLRILVPLGQRLRVKKTAEFHRVDEIKRYRVYTEDLARNPSDYVLLFRQGEARALARAGCLRDASLVWSLWEGYLREEAGRRLSAFLREQGIPLIPIHTSGHASVEDLARLVEALSPKRVVPIHTEAPERFGDLFSNVELHSDGEWWTT
ncbi:MAG: MBL fold metallo-hydrolase [Pseudomonadota bacterium]